MQEEEFYIGWQEKAPNSFTKTAKKFLLGTLILLVGFVVVYIPSQQEFSDSIFEYGELTELKGTLVSYPVYGLKTTVEDKQITVPLVGFGKSGVDALAKNLIQKLGDDPENFQVSLKGTLIKYNGKIWMELTEGENSIISFKKSVIAGSTQLVTQKGPSTLMGEIVDPKCFFGVMKPAFSKIHRSCAVRCISGGIPPIFAIRKDGKYVDYYFLIGENGTKLNNEVLSYVGKSIEINGLIEQVDDWHVLKIKPEALAIEQAERLDLQIASCN